MILNQVPSDPIIENNKASQSFRIFLSKLFTVVSSIEGSGTTANRPTTHLWVGRFYFDSTLNKPIWVKTTSPVVWVDATGASV